MDWLLAVLCTVSLLHMVSSAPDCELRSIFKTPKDFDDFELIERSNFEDTETKAEAENISKLIETPTSIANAQILLRIGCDKHHSHKHCEQGNRTPNNEGKTIQDNLPHRYQDFWPGIPYNFPYYFCCNPYLFYSSPQNSYPRDIIVNQILKTNSEDLKNDDDYYKILNQRRKSSGQTVLNREPLYVNPLQDYEPNVIIPDTIDTSATLDQNRLTHPYQPARPNVLKPVEITPVIERPCNSCNNNYEVCDNNVETPCERSTVPLLSNLRTQIPRIPFTTQGKIIETIRLHPSIIKLEDNDNRKTQEAESQLELRKFLKDATIPYFCRNCDQQYKNLLSYPIFKTQSQKDVDYEVPFVNKPTFSYDEDDLTKISSERILEQSCKKRYPLLNLKVHNNRVCPTRPPVVDFKAYQVNSAQGFYEDPERIITYEQPPTFNTVESIIPSNTGVLPSYLSKSCRGPLPVYQNPCSCKNDKEVILEVVPVKRTRTCNGCTPYERELNE